MSEAQSQLRVLLDAVAPFRDAVEQHPLYARSLNNVGALFHKMGDYARAEPLLRQTLERLDGFARALLNVE